MPGYTLQRRGTVRSLPSLRIVLFVSIVLFCVFFVSIVLFYVLFVCKCLLYYCLRVATQLQLNISYHYLRAHLYVLLYQNMINLSACCDQLSKQKQ